MGSFLHTAACAAGADSVRPHPSHAYLCLEVSSARRRLNKLLPSRQQRWHSPDHRSKLPRRSLGELRSAHHGFRGEPAPAQQRGVSRQVAQRLGHRIRRPRPRQALLPAALANQARSARGSAHPGTAVRGHPHQERAAVRIQAAVRGHQCRFAVSVHVWALQRIVATARGWVTRFRTRKLKITKMASDLRRGGLAPDRPQ